jgi:hypothetical protein
MTCNNLSSREVDIEELDRKYNVLIQRTFESPTQELIDNNQKYTDVVNTILSRDIDYSDFRNLKQLLRKYSISVKNSFIFQVFLLFN